MHETTSLNPHALVWCDLATPHQGMESVSLPPWGEVSFITALANRTGWKWKLQVWFLPGPQASFSAFWKLPCVCTTSWDQRAMRRPGIWTGYGAWNTIQRERQRETERQKDRENQGAYTQRCLIWGKESIILEVDPPAPAASAAVMWIRSESLSPSGITGALLKFMNHTSWEE